MAVQKTALWFGRFQPPTVAHVAALYAILEQWEALVVGIVSEEPGHVCDLDSRWGEYRRKMDELSYGTAKNPFMADEVMQMWTAFVRVSGLADRVAFSQVRRPESYEELNVLYPPTAYDFIQINNGSDDPYIDDFRRVHGAEMYRRPIFWVTPLFTLHNTEIRGIVSRSDAEWEKFIPRGAYEKFIEIDGPARVSGTVALHEGNKVC